MTTLRRKFAVGDKVRVYNRRRKVAMHFHGVGVIVSYTRRSHYRVLFSDGHGEYRSAAHLTKSEGE